MRLPHLAFQLCQAAELPNDTLSTALRLCRVAVGQGVGKADSSAIALVTRDMARMDEQKGDIYEENAIVPHIDRYTGGI
jgi:hypothetical protein